MRQGPVIDWLLETSQPWIRYNTLVDLLETPSKVEARETLERAMRTPPKRAHRWGCGVSDALLHG
ncbi:MAG: hypothetical protein NTY03_07920 [Candidatus Bathyarchaeota archaeon]|nr:hypothetical protein [Candidatus Bathyarchaeota archaeon]